MGHDALEQALALQEAPQLRQSVVARPLPDDIAELMQIASGSPALLAAAAQRSGTNDARVLEAARFYLQEVLFFPGADAYRVLGMTRDASDDQLKAHYRLLQRWLHPDREEGDGMSVHATRVNRAWGELRTVARRTEYDRRLDEVGTAPATESRAAASPKVLVTGWRAERAASPGFRRAWPLLALLGGCGLLTVMVLRQKTLEPPAWEHSAESMGSETQGGGDLYSAAVASSQATDDQPQRSSRGGTPARQRPDQMRHAMPQPSPTTPRTPVAAAARADPAGPSSAVPVAPDLSPSPDERQARGQAVAAAMPSQPEARPAADDPPPTREAVAAALEPPQLPSPRPIASRSATVALDSTGPAPASVAAAAATTTPAASGAEQPAATVELAKVVAAQQRVRQVAQYLAANRSRTPPVWNDIRTQEQAERVRQALHGRNAGNGRRSQALSLAEPHWSIGTDTARLDSGYRLTRSRDLAESGRLRMTMVWREDRWLVSRLLLDPAQP